jgi:TPR repeat protein
MLLAKAAQGDAEAMVALGQDAEDLVEEVDWYRRAAEAGSAEGLYHLAVCCFQGRGVPEDKAEARRWFQRAAAAGHAGAREALAGLFPDR